MANRVEKVASDVLGAVKTAKATIENLSGVLKHLTRDHGEVAARIGSLKAISRTPAQRETWVKPRGELLSDEGQLGVAFD